MHNQAQNDPKMDFLRIYTCSEMGKGKGVFETELSIINEVNRHKMDFFRIWACHIPFEAYTVELISEIGKL